MELKIQFGKQNNKDANYLAEIIDDYLTMFWWYWICYKNRIRKRC